MQNLYIKGHSWQTWGQNTWPIYTTKTQYSQSSITRGIWDPLIKARNIRKRDLSIGCDWPTITTHECCQVSQIATTTGCWAIIGICALRWILSECMVSQIKPVSTTKFLLFVFHFCVKTCSSSRQIKTYFQNINWDVCDRELVAPLYWLTRK